jgi:hypothetical protein
MSMATDLHQIVEQPVWTGGAEEPKPAERPWLDVLAALGVAPAFVVMEDEDEDADIEDDDDDFEWDDEEEEFEEGEEEFADDEFEELEDDDDLDDDEV